ncbi:MAG: hypothetical protein IPN49_08295 [Saprospiraceae bacterium]|nr:hypothetical protein [Saprospiraceae bacterium]MBK8082285.1 hypothetical protein [Saprospiraceae bacterium]MBK8369980.1 hypothetical protein [Saprospiraceae bacterium]MBK8819078.1 hypothetical protein [Saprospiraceae bacterium]
MKSLMLSKTWLVVFGMIALLSACNKNDTTEAEVETYVEETVYRIQETGNMGKFGCYELSFPITLTYPDGSVSEEINSYEELKQVLRTWRQENDRPRVRPVITLPFSVITEDGDLITVETTQDLRVLKMECRRMFFENNGPNGHDGRGKFCFKLEFPVSILYPDGTTVAYTDRREMHKALRQWRKDNRGATERPHLVFPLNVIMEDGTVVTVNSKEELKALKEGCN